MNLEEYLKKNTERNVYNHALKVTANGDIYIHPMGTDGDTLDYRVEGDKLTPKSAKVREYESTNLCSHLILYTLEEGKEFATIGCHSEELADGYLDRFEKYGDMRNPRYYGQQGMKPYIDVHSMIKVERKRSLYKAPEDETYFTPPGI